MSTPKEHIDFQWAELRKLDLQLTQMRQWGVSETDPGYQRLFSARGTAMGKLGLLKPRTTTLIVSRAGLSPGELKLWADAELGFKVEARVSPGASPVYRFVSDAIAEKIVKGILTHEEFTELIAPDPYEGE